MHLCSQLIKLLILNNTLPELRGRLHNSFSLLLHGVELSGNFFNGGLTLRNLLQRRCGLYLGLEQQVSVLKLNQILPQSLGLFDWGEPCGVVKNVLAGIRNSLLNFAAPGTQLRLFNN